MLQNIWWLGSLGRRRRKSTNKKVLTQGSIPIERVGTIMKLETERERERERERINKIKIKKIFTWEVEQGDK